MHHSVRVFAVLLVLHLLPGLASPALAQWTPRNCASLGQNLFVRDVMLDLYYWYRFVPNVEASRFRSPEEYLDAVRYRPLDTSFSFIASQAETEALYSSSQFVGFGLSTSTSLIDGGTDVIVRVSQVFPESPAAEAGLLRGDRIVSVGGVTVFSWWQSGRLGEMFGPGDIGYRASIVFQHTTGEAVFSSMTKRVVTIPTVSAAEVIEVEGRKVGYLFFRNFVEPSIAALDEAFARFRDAEVSELVLDLRYNGGGLVSVAQHLASLIGGLRTEGQVLGEYFHNERHTSRNMTLRFEAKEHALALDRVVAITTGASASASELVVNALRPFMPVVTVGGTTYGKPVGQYGIDFCGKTLFPVAFTIRNANGEGDYFGGIAPTCAARDDLDRQIADVEEASLAEALHVIRTGGCSETTASSAKVSMAGVLRVTETGFQQLVGAR